MPAFHASGATGQAPTTSFLGAIGDLGYNCMNPGHEINTGKLYIHDNNKAPANNVNTWIPFNTSMLGGVNAVTLTLGAMTTAPDGTNTAQKIVEAATSSQHYLTAVSQGCGDGVTMRLAVFAKAAERTRMVLALGQAGYGGGQAGSRTVFDLANGVVAVPGVVVGDWGALADTIVPFGSGWYLCMIDVGVGTHFFTGRDIGYCYIDSGSGNAAESTNYLGNGTSGIYIWRATLLPAECWGISGQSAFFDDFNDNTMAEFDLNNTLAPGFKWYYHACWPLFYGTSRNPSTSSVSGSELHLGPEGGNTGLWNTASWLGPDAGTGGATINSWSSGTTYAAGNFAAFQAVGGTTLYQSLQNSNLNNQPDISPSFWSVFTAGTVGQSFILPTGLVEINGRVLANGGSGISTFFQTVQMLLTTQETGSPNNNFGPGYATSYFEDDIIEESIHSGTINAHHRDQCTSSNIGSTSVLLASYAGFPLWVSTFPYGAGATVFYSNQLYQAQTSTTNNQPDISPTQWQVFDPSTNVTQVATAAGTNQFDTSLSHLYSKIYVRYRKDKEPYGKGQIWYFFDRIQAQQALDNTPTAVNYGLSYGSGNHWNVGWTEYDMRPIIIRITGSNCWYGSFAIIK